MAINLFDVTDRMAGPTREKLLPLLDLSAPVRLDAEDDVGVPFVCDLLTAASVCDVLRHQNRAWGDYATRVYVFRGSSWVRLPSTTDLTSVDEDGVYLNPAVFPPEKVVLPYG